MTNIEIWVNLQRNRAQNAMKIKETLLSGIYIEAEKTKKYLENLKLLLSVICIEPEIERSESWPIYYEIGIKIHVIYIEAKIGNCKFGLV